LPTSVFNVKPIPTSAAGRGLLLFGLAFGCLEDAFQLLAVILALALICSVVRPFVAASEAAEKASGPRLPPNNPHAGTSAGQGSV
jgi:hypothetical protein